MGDFEIVDLFAGPGGLDVAAHSLGIPVTGIELNEDACKTRNAFAESQRDRGPSMTTVHRNVRNADPRDYGSANVLAAGPPCQTFSVAGTGTGRKNLDQVYSYIDRMAAGEDVTGELADLEDARTGLVLEPLKWVLTREKENPFQVVVLEQVPAVLPVWQKMAEVLGNLGFDVDAHILHAEEYGVPQTRKRAILIARRGTSVEFPAHTHQRYRKGIDPVPVEDHPRGLHPWNSMNTVLKRRGEFTVVSNYGTGGDPKNRGLRTHLDPAFTVTGKIGRNRLVGTDGEDQKRLDTSEAGLLQTFPHDYPWRGKDVHQQIGNAIPPLLAAHVLIAALGLPKKDVGSVLGYDGFLCAVAEADPRHDGHRRISLSFLFPVCATSFDFDATVLVNGRRMGERRTMPNGHQPPLHSAPPCADWSRKFVRLPLPTARVLKIFRSWPSPSR